MQNTFKRISILVVALLPVLVLSWVVLKPDADDEVGEVVAINEPVVATTQTNTPPASPSATASVTIVPASGSGVAQDPAAIPVSRYKDGTYSVTASYDSPAGKESIGVRITLAGDVITASSVTNMSEDGTSSRFQDAFIAGHKTFVIGKNIADVKLDKISGSSLTPKGFNEALSVIMVKAAA